MAAKQEPEIKEPVVPEDKAPESAKVAEEVRDNGAGAGREPSIQKAPKKSFDERTGSGTPPWQREDGSQDNGSEE